MSKDRSGLFIITTYLLTWSIAVPAALVRKRVIEMNIPNALKTFASWSPAIVAILVSVIFFGPANLKALLKGVFKWKVGIQWYSFAIGMGLLTSGFSLLITSSFSTFTISLDPVHSILFLLIIIFFFSPLWEEIGWRGFLLPRLQQRYSPLEASLIIGLVWGLWHLPLVIASNANGEKNMVFFIFLFFGCFPISILQTWIYNSTRGSILLCIIFHDAINVGVSYFFMNVPNQEMSPFQISVLIFFCLAAVIYFIDRKLGYRPES